jgi:hypothetical protein
MYICVYVYMYIKVGLIGRFGIGGGGFNTTYNIQHTRIHTYTHTHIHTYTHTHTHIHTYTHTQIHTYTQTHIPCEESRTSILYTHGGS